MDSRNGGWQPIATAPKDQRILAYWPGGGDWRVDAPGVQLTSWWPTARGGQFIALAWTGGVLGDQPTYWQPLPPPPEPSNG